MFNETCLGSRLLRCACLGPEPLVVRGCHGSCACEVRCQRGLCRVRTNSHILREWLARHDSVNFRRSLHNSVLFSKFCTLGGRRWRSLARGDPRLDEFRLIPKTRAGTGKPGPALVAPGVFPGGRATEQNRNEQSREEQQGRGSKRSGRQRERQTEGEADREIRASSHPLTGTSPSVTPHSQYPQDAADQAGIC